LRLAPDKPMRPYHAWQPVYGLFFYAIGLMHLVWIEDFSHFAKSRRDDPASFRTGAAITAFAASKGLHLLLFLAIPATVLKPTLAGLLAGYLLATAVATMIFIGLAAGTHISEHALFPKPDADGRLAHDWALYQLLTSVDWMPTNRLVTHLVGGANAHVAHHLFPGHSHRHAVMLSGIIAETATAHGHCHRIVSFRDIVRGHWRHLVRLSRAPEIPGGLSAAAAAGASRRDPRPSA
jgi:linoleoyl-CoA desaturase